MRGYDAVMLIRALLLLLSSAALLALAPGVRADGCAPKVRDGWIRLTPGGMPMHAGFGRIDNPCAMPLTIVSARSPGYGSVELHESRIVDGVSRMRAVPRLRIAPDGAAVFKPGGLHLMLMEPAAPLKPGSRIVVEFEASDGRTVRGEFVARPPNAN